MSYTAAQLLERVLQRLNVLAAGETATDEDSALVTPICTNCHAELRNLGIAPYELSAIPEELMEGLVDYVAVSAGPNYGRAYPPGALEEAEGRIRRQLRLSTNGRLIKANYF